MRVCESVCVCVRTRACAYMHVCVLFLLLANTSMLPFYTKQCL